MSCDKFALTCSVTSSKSLSKIWNPSKDVTAMYKNNPLSTDLGMLSIGYGIRRSVVARSSKCVTRAVTRFSLQFDTLDLRRKSQWKVR